MSCIRGCIWSENTALSLNYGTGTSLRCCEDVKDHAVLYTTCLIKETSEFSRRIAWLLSSTACSVNFVKPSIWLITVSNPNEGTKVAAKCSCQWNTDLLIKLVPIVDWLGSSLNCHVYGLESKGILEYIFLLIPVEAKAIN